MTWVRWSEHTFFVASLEAWVVGRESAAATLLAGEYTLIFISLSLVKLALNNITIRTLSCTRCDLTVNSLFNLFNERQKRFGARLHEIRCHVLECKRPIMRWLPCLVKYLWQSYPNGRHFLVLWRKLINYIPGLPLNIAIRIVWWSSLEDKMLYSLKLCAELAGNFLHPYLWKFVWSTCRVHI